MDSRFAALVRSLLLCLATACAPQAPELSVDAQQPERADSGSTQPKSPLATQRGYVGVVVARESVDIAPKAAGELVAVHVRVGDRVEAGEPIARLDDRLAREELEMTQASLHAAKARHSQAKISAAQARRAYEESKSLVRAGHASRSDLREADSERLRSSAAVKETQAETANLRASLRQRQRVLAETVLTAPFSGRIAERYADGGTVVAAGSRIVRLISGTAPWVRFAVPPADIGRLTVGDIVRTEVETLDASVRATVHQVTPEVDTASRLVFVEAQLEFPEGADPGPQTGAAVRVYLGS